MTTLNRPVLQKQTNKNLQKFSIPLKISNYNPNFDAVGIDLGTTECCVSVIRKNGPDFVVLDQITGLRTMPSYVAFDEKVPKCGQIAIDRMRHKAEYTVYDSKRIIGKTFEEIVVDSLWPFNLVNQNDTVKILVETSNGQMLKNPEDISSALLKYIKNTTEIYQGKKLTEAIIAVPSSFTQKQINATANAAKLAGWETIHFIPEPVAAAFAYFMEIDIPNQSNIIICDCGGGTIDVCVANVTNNRLEVLCYDGDPYLGGRDFDKLLFNHFDAILKHKHGFDITKGSKKYVLKQKCRDIKHKLSAAYDDHLDVDDFDNNSNEVIKITRDDFEAMTSDLLLRIKNVILQAITKAELKRSQINYVFQVGGGCRMPMIKELLSNIFPHAKQECNLYPDWIVAHGAALYAYHLKTEANAIQLKETLRH
uniref:Heat shock protein 70 n=1 Tax=Panagrolaimus sp. ES5 TaxID=591445 RepID=A0AC34FW47_9BILA